MDIYKCPNPENRFPTQNTKNKKNMENRVFPVCDHNALTFVFMKNGCDDNYFCCFLMFLIRKGLGDFYISIIYE